MNFCSQKAKVIHVPISRRGSFSGKQYMKMGYVKLLYLCESCVSPGEFPHMAVLLRLLIFKTVWSFSAITFTKRTEETEMIF